MDGNVALALEVRSTSAVKEGRKLGQAIAIAPEGDVGELLA
jgi:hypothetical protein